MQKILTDLQEHSYDLEQKIKSKHGKLLHRKGGLQTCIRRVQYFSYYAKKHLLVSYSRMATFVPLRHPVTILVTEFTNPNNLTDKSCDTLPLCTTLKQSDIRKSLIHIPHGGQT